MVRLASIWPLFGSGRGSCGEGCCWGEWGLSLAAEVPSRPQLLSGAPRCPLPRIPAPVTQQVWASGDTMV